MDASDNCTAHFFRTFKQVANQNWINETKMAAWEEGKEPDWKGKTTSVGEVPNAFTDYYKMLYQPKK